MADVNAFQAEAPPALPHAARTAAAPAAALPDSGAPVPLGGVIAAAPSSVGGPSAPAVAVAPDGGFLLVWRDDLDAATVHGRLYDAAGNPRGDPFPLSAPGMPAGNPRTAADPSGRFLAVWPGARGISGRLFGAGSLPAGPEVLLAPGPFLASPDVISDPAGGFLLSWEDQGAQGVDRTIHVQRFDLRLTPGTRALIAAPGLVGAPPRLAALIPGGYAVTWSSANPTTGTPDADLWAQRLDPALEPLGDPIPVARAQSGTGAGVPVAYADGGFACLWSTGDTGAYPHDENDTLVARRFDADGAPEGEAVIFHHGVGNAAASPAALPLPSGDAWVVWHERNFADDPEGGLYAGLFDPSWHLQGTITGIKTGSAGAQSEPAVASAPGGTVAVWASLPVNDPAVVPSPDYLGIFARRFSPLDCALASDQLCLAGRFRVTARFTDPRLGGSAAAQAIPLTADTGYFWFFDPPTWNDRQGARRPRRNGHFWVFYGALTNVEYTLTVTDTQTGLARRYFNPAGQFASVGDTQGFGPLGAYDAVSRAAAGPPSRGVESIADTADIADITKIGTCVPAPGRLCLNGGRFAVRPPGQTSRGTPGPAGRGAERRHRLFLVLRPRQRGAGGQGARRHGGERPLLGLLRRALQRRVQAHRDGHPDRPREDLHESDGPFASVATAPLSIPRPPRPSSPPSTARRWPPRRTLRSPWAARSRPTSPRARTPATGSRSRRSRWHRTAASWWSGRTTLRHAGTP